MLKSGKTTVFFSTLPYFGRPENLAHREKPTAGAIRRKTKPPPLRCCFSAASSSRDLLRFLRGAVSFGEAKKSTGPMARSRFAGFFGSVDSHFHRRFFRFALHHRTSKGTKPSSDGQRYNPPGNAMGALFQGSRANADDGAPLSFYSD